MSASKVLVCKLRVEEFKDILSELINNENSNFDCNCDTYGNHQNLIIFCQQWDFNFIINAYFCATVAPDEF